MAKTPRLTAAIAAELDDARRHSERTARPARRFKDFTWSTLDSWSRSRRVIAKAESTGGEANPRFVVTSLSRAEHEARHLYEKVYCARGEMENRIKECQLDLFAADDAALLEEAAAADAAWTKASAAESEELYGDYQLVVGAIGERLYEVREAFAGTLDPEKADEYRAVFDRTVRKRFRRYAAFLEGPD